MYFIIEFNYKQIISQIEEGKDLNINLYEILLEQDLLSKKELIEVYLLDCQCAIFLIDITNKNSFDLVKELINLIDKDKFPYLQKILIENKLEEIKDLFENNEIKKDKMGKYLNLIELNDKYSKLLKINWEILDFKDYFKNPYKLLKAIIIINDDLTQF